MKTEKIENIIIRFLNQEASHSELITLDIWLQNEKNLQIFNQYCKTEYFIIASMDEFNLEQAKLSIKKKLKISKRKKRFDSFKKYAAAIVVIGICLTAIVTYNYPNESKNVISETNRAILTLSSGDKIEVKKGTPISLQNWSNTNSTLEYRNNGDVKSSNTKFNELYTPKGSIYSVLLSDSTKIWLNSETKIKYPTNFSKTQTRTVELVYGEAYFEVSPSTKNNDTKFVVKSNLQNIEVLGTKFNLKAYKDEINTYTTLVEGKVKVNSSFDETLLKPNYQSIISYNSEKFILKEANISEIIAWKNGVFSFRKLPLADIMRTLSRWYDVDVVFLSQEISSIQLTGVFDKEQSIEDILSIIAITNSKVTNSKKIAYEINNNTIIFK